MPSPISYLDPKLKNYASTDRQKHLIDLVNKLGSYKAAAEKLGINAENVSKSIAVVKRHAAKAGYHPDTPYTEAPPGFSVKSKSTLTDAEGNLKLIWTKTDADQEQVLKAIHEGIESVCSGITPIPPIEPPCRQPNEDLCTLYTLTDFHLGMYAWHAETGNNWDLNIAHKCLLMAINEMMDGSPTSGVAILNIQGDFLHWDGLIAQTPTAQHPVEADTRYGKLVELTLNVTRDAIALLLQKHPKVRVIIVEGNHDIVGSIWLRKALRALYTENPRCEIDDTEFPFYAYLHGEIMLGIHHGHKVANKSLPALFASEPRYRSMWGQARYTYIHTGHYHRTEQDMSEAGGAIVERHPTLAGRDAYAARGGFVSWRAARAITYHTTRGETRRTSTTPSEALSELCPVPICEAS